MSRLQSLIFSGEVGSYFHQNENIAFTAGNGWNATSTPGGFLGVMRSGTLHYNLTGSPQLSLWFSPPRTVLVMACWRRRGRFDDYDDYHYLNRRSNRRHATLTGFCLFAAFLLFLLVALSLPIIKSIYLLQLDGITSSTQPTTSVGTRLRFGVWGFCATRSASYSLLEERRPGRGETDKNEMILQCAERQHGRVHRSTTGVYNRPADHRRRDQRAEPGEPHPQGSLRPARAAPGCRKPRVAHAPARHRLVFRVPPSALDHLPRVVRPDRNRVHRRAWCGPGPRYRRKEQGQGPVDRQCLNRLRERRVDGACEHALHLDRDGATCRTRLSLLWIRKVIVTPLLSLHVTEMITGATGRITLNEGQEEVGKKVYESGYPTTVLLLYGYP